MSAEGALAQRVRTLAAAVAKLNDGVRQVAAVIRALDQRTAELTERVAALEAASDVSREEVERG